MKQFRKAKALEVARKSKPIEDYKQNEVETKLAELLSSKTSLEEKLKSLSAGKLVSLKESLISEA